MTDNGCQSWYVVCCKPRQENVARDNLIRQGFDIYFPQLSTRQRRRGKWDMVVQPLFPRYLFLRADIQHQSLAVVRSTRGALGLVRFGGEPAVVPDTLVKAIIARADPLSGLHGDVANVIAIGCKVQIQEGPFTGIDAVFGCNDGESRAFLLIELLGKTNTVSVPRESLAKAA